MNSKLTGKIRSLEERDKLIGELDILINSLYEEKGQGFQSALKNKIRHWVFEIIENETKETQVDLKKYLEDIKNNLLSKKVLRLKLAFEPTDLSIDKFYMVAQRDLGLDVILDFDYDPGILGGAVITWDGKYRDFSLKRLFEQDYKEKLADVMKIMYSK